MFVLLLVGVLLCFFVLCFVVVVLCVPVCCVLFCLMDVYFDSSCLGSVVFVFCVV